MIGWKLISVKTGVQYNTLLISRWSPSRAQYYCLTVFHYDGVERVKITRIPQHRVRFNDFAYSVSVVIMFYSINSYYYDGVE